MSTEQNLIKNSFIKYSQSLNIINNKLKDQFSKKREHLQRGWRGSACVCGEGGQGGHHLLQSAGSPAEPNPCVAAGKFNPVGTPSGQVKKKKNILMGKNPGLSCCQSSNESLRHPSLKHLVGGELSPRLHLPSRREWNTSTQQASFFLFFCCSVSLCTYTLLLLLPGTTISCCCCCLVRLKRFRKPGSLSLALLEWLETLQGGETDRHRDA